VLEEQKDETGCLLAQVISSFRKQTKDPFVLQFLNTQTVNNYLFA
jgi:hypothetical protein